MGVRQKDILGVGHDLVKNTILGLMQSIPTIQNINNGYTENKQM
jgi:hypothetical protein